MNQTNFKPTRILTFEEPMDGSTPYYEFKELLVAMSPVKEKREKPDEDMPYHDLYSNEQLSKIELLNPHIKREKEALQGVKTIYFDEDCTVPRFKLKEFCSKYGITIVHDSTKSDAIIVSDKIADYLLYYDSLYTLNKKENLIKIIPRLKPQYNLKKEILPLIKALPDNTMVYIESMSDRHDKMEVKPKYKGDDDPEVDVCYTYIADQILYDKLITNGNLIHQDVILESLAETIMDKDMYNTVSSMLKSPNIEDNVLAMEIMANVNYRESIVYLLDLMRRFNSDTISCVPQRKNISFKALVGYLTYAPYGRNDSSSFTEIVDVIIKKNLLTEKNYRILLELIKEQEIEDNENAEEPWVPIVIDLAPKLKSKIIWEKKEEAVLDPEEILS